jgi:hypothetical protein
VNNLSTLLVFISSVQISVKLEVKPFTSCEGHLMVSVRVLEESQNSLHVKVPEHEIRDLMNQPLAKFLQLEKCNQVDMKCKAID